jgi:three-Cys-motif partner protein
MPLLWPLEPATAAKHKLYKRYLDAWWPKMLQPSRKGWLRPRVTYVDAFAGPGIYEGGEDGSPVFALERLLNHAAVTRMGLSRERVRLVFIEKQHDRYVNLIDVLVKRFGPLDELPVHVAIRENEAAAACTLLDELDAWGRGHAVLAVFDSWGNVNVPLEEMTRIGRSEAGEVIVTFGPNWFSRRKDMEPDQLDKVFGGNPYWQPANDEIRPDERWRAWLAAYRAALARAGFAHRLQFEVVPRTGQPLYLVFGTGHEAGVEVMKDAMWKVDYSDGMSFRDPRTRGAVVPGQLSIEHATDDAQQELQELAIQRLDRGPATVEQLGQWLLLETAKWRPRDARTVADTLRNEGLVTTQPPGRITNATLVSLRHHT